MKRICVLLTALALLFTIISVSCAEQYKYSFSDYIPESVQKNAVQYMLSKEAGIIDREKALNYAELLDVYINYYGIYCPETNKTAGTVTWVQNMLINDPDRITYIPERYMSASELTSWVTRYAEPGDLLLYRINGFADKCAIFVGEGKMIGMYNHTNRVVDIRATFEDGASRRTKSSGLFAIAHMWKKEVVSDETFLNLQLTMDGSAETFTQNQYVVWEKDPVSGDYVKASAFILTEYQPGIYRFWNGKHYGFDDAYVQTNDGIHLKITDYKNDESQIRRMMKIDLSAEDAAAAKETEESTISMTTSTNSENTFQWSGNDLIEIIRKAGNDND